MHKRPAPKMLYLNKKSIMKKLDYGHFSIKSIHLFLFGYNMVVKSYFMWRSSNIYLQIFMHEINNIYN